MSERYSSDFDILTQRQPVKRSATDSILRAIAEAVKSELGNVLTAVNRVYDARWINTSDGTLLDEHGEKLSVPRETGETDAEYKARLLAQFQDLPVGLTNDALYDAVFEVTDPDEPVITEWWKYPWLWPEYADETGYFGNNNAGDNFTTVVTNANTACKFTLTDDAAVKTMKVYIGPTGGIGSRTIYGAIYEDDGGDPSAPAAKVADAEASLTISTAKWQTFTFDDVALDKDTDYWLAVNSTGGSCDIYYDAGDANQSAGRIDTPPPNDPFGAVAVYNPYALSIYAGYSVRNPDFTSGLFYNDMQSRFTVSVLLDTSPSAGELDTIEDNVRDVKPAHVVIRIVRDYTTYHELLRETL